MSAAPSMIAFVHTSPVHVASFQQLLGELAPSTPALHHVDESLLSDARRLGSSDQGLIDRVQQAMRQMAAQGADVVVCTCSTIGGIAERMPCDGSFVPMRIDRPMADASVQLGPDIAVLAALESTLGPTVGLLEDSARKLHATVRITPFVIADAWSFFERGEMNAYHACIAAAARQLAAQHSVLVLAQASMAGATGWLTELEPPVLSSPRLGVLAAIETMIQQATLRQRRPRP